MGAPLLVTDLNIRLSEYLALHSEQLPEGIIVNTKSYIRTEYGYQISDFEDKDYNYSEIITMNVEFVEYGRNYYPYEVEYSIARGIVNATLLKEGTDL